MSFLFPGVQLHLPLALNTGPTFFVLGVTLRSPCSAGVEARPLARPRGEGVAAAPGD